MILVKSLIVILLILILAQLYKYFNKEKNKKEGFSEIGSETDSAPSGGGIQSFADALPMSASMREKAELQGPTTQTPTAAQQVSALQVSASNKSPEIEQSLNPFLVPLKPDTKVSEAMQDMKADIQKNPLTEDVMLKFAELEKLGNQAKEILKF